MPDYWYSFSVFRHTRQQNHWAILNRSFFDEGKWPPMSGEFTTDEYDKEQKKLIERDEKASTYTEAPIGKRQVKCEAYFERPILVIAEIETRLETTGEAGEALLDEIGADFPLDDLSGPALRALNYISGIRRRKKTYAQWRAATKYSGKKG